MAEAQDARRKKPTRGLVAADALPVVTRFPGPARTVRWESQCCGKCPERGFCLRFGWCSRDQRAERMWERRPR